MKILAFAASNSRQSINKRLVSYAGGLLAQMDSANEVEILDINDYEMPLFSVDREAELGTPAAAQSFFNKIGEADAVLISFAEHNGSYTVAYKNLFDWASRIDQKVFQDKPMILLATSPGPGGARNVLGAATNSMPFFGGVVKGSLSVPGFYGNFDAEGGKITNPEIDRALRETLGQLTVEKI